MGLPIENGAARRLRITGRPSRTNRNSVCATDCGQAINPYRWPVYGNFRPPTGSCHRPRNDLHPVGAVPNSPIGEPWQSGETANSLLPVAMPYAAIVTTFAGFIERVYWRSVSATDLMTAPFGKRVACVSCGASRLWSIVNLSGSSYNSTQGCSMFHNGSREGGRVWAERSERRLGTSSPCVLRGFRTCPEIIPRFVRTISCWSRCVGGTLKPRAESRKPGPVLHSPRFRLSAFRFCVHVLLVRFARKRELVPRQILTDLQTTGCGHRPKVGRPV